MQKKIMLSLCLPGRGKRTILNEPFFLSKKKIRISVIKYISSHLYFSPYFRAENGLLLLVELGERVCLEIFSRKLISKLPPCAETGKSISLAASSHFVVYVFKWGSPWHLNTFLGHVLMVIIYFNNYDQGYESQECIY